MNSTMWADLADFAIFFVVTFVFLLLIMQLLVRLLLRLAQKTQSSYDEIYLRSIKKYLRLLVLAISLKFSTARLESLPPAIEQVLDQVYYAAIILLAAVMVWILVDHLVLWYQDLARKAGKREPKEAALLLIQRTGHILVVIISSLLILDHFGVNINAVIATLGIGGLAVSLAAQDTLSNMVSGVMLVIDQPFRIGDRIEIQGLTTWGDVVDIGLRSTRIRTVDNRMIIVPNSSISRNFVINYSYPDPLYRGQIDIKVVPGLKSTELRKVITDAVRRVEGVMADKPVDVLFVDFDNDKLSIRVHWWNESYIDYRNRIDQITEAIYLALNTADGTAPHKEENP